MTIDFQNIAQLRTVIQNYILNSSCEYMRMKEQAEQGFQYYDNCDSIKKTGAAAIDDVNAFLRMRGSNPLRSADNRISANRHRVVVDQKVGYMFTVPPQFDLPSDDSDAADEQTLKKVNDTVGTQWPKVVRQLGLDASNTGRAWLSYWQDNDTGKYDYWYVNPLTCAPIYDRSTVKQKLLYLIRVYGYNDGNGNPVTRYEIWSDAQVAYLVQPQASSAFPRPPISYETLPDGNWNIQPHQYGRIPFIEFRNNAKALPDLIMYKDFIDALDKLLSGFANDIDDIQEILWVIKNYKGDEDTPVYDKSGNVVTDNDGNPVTRPVDRLMMMKAKKIVDVDGDGGVDALRNEIPFEARKAFRDILDTEFWTAAMAVNPNPPTGTGNQSGVYIDYLYGLLELKAGLMETEFRASIDEFLQSVLHYLNADETLQFVQTWKRTKPQNNAEIAQIIAQVPDTVMSEETKTKICPYITDWQAERAQIEKEQSQKQQDTLDNLGQLAAQHDHLTTAQPESEKQPNEDGKGGDDA